MNAYERRRELARLKRVSRNAAKKYKLQLREHQILRAYETAHKEVHGFEPTISKNLAGGWYTVQTFSTRYLRLNDFPKATSLLYAEKHSQELYRVEA